MQKIKLNSLTQLNPALISTSMKPVYRPRYKTEFILSELQRRAYSRLLHGMKGYTTEELKQMSEEDKRSIVYLSNKAWNVINVLKQKRLNAFLNGILSSILPNLVGNMVPFLKEEITDNNFIPDRNLKEINVSEQVIVLEFIKNRLLPSNFLS